MSTLSELDQLCFECILPGGCNERDPRCLRRRALEAGTVSRVVRSRSETYGDRILDRLELGPMSVNQLRMAMDIGYSTLTGILCLLVRQGRAVRLERGLYALADWDG